MHQSFLICLYLSVQTQIILASTN